MMERDLSREMLGIRAYFLGETELSIAENVEAHVAGKQSVYELTFWECIEQTVEFAGGEAY